MSTSKRNRKFNIAKNVNLTENTELMKLYESDPEFKNIMKARIYKRSLEVGEITTMDQTDLNLIAIAEL